MSIQFPLTISLQGREELVNMHGVNDKNLERAICSDADF